MKTFKLSDITTLITSVLKNSLPNNYWIVAEIANITLNRGHCYLVLVEKSEADEVIAQMRATIWAYKYRSLSNQFQEATNDSLKKGMKVLILTSINFHGIYSLSLNIEDIDPSYTLGEMARKRKEIIEQLTKETLIDRNKALEIPLVTQRLAVVSSPSAAGYQDFINQLDNNRYGYVFHYTLFSAMMQGQETESSILLSLSKIAANKNLFDTVVIIRGGGSQVDLSYFDNYKLGVSIATFPLPVLTGIGHERDETVVDLVAHTKLKTPTAVAEFLIARVRSFEERVIVSQKRLHETTSKILRDARYHLNITTTSLINQTKHLIRDHTDNLRTCINNFTRLTNQLISDNKSNVLVLTTRCKSSCGRFFERKQDDRLLVLNRLKSSTLTFMGQSGQALIGIVAAFRYKPFQLVAEMRNNLLLVITKAISHTSRFFLDQRNILSKKDQAIKYLAPDNVLKRGYSITLHNGKAIKNTNNIRNGDHLETRLYSGSVMSSVDSIKEDNNE